MVRELLKLTRESLKVGVLEYFWFILWKNCERCEEKKNETLLTFSLSHQHDQFLGTLTGRGVSRVNYEVSRLSKLHEDARRCSKDFQQVWHELEMFKVW